MYKNNGKNIKSSISKDDTKTKKQIATQEIIRQDAQRHGFDPKQVVETVAKLKLSN